MRHRLGYPIALLVCLLALPFSAFAGDVVSVSVERHQETITVSASSVVPHKVFILPNPYRLVVDLPTLRGRHDIALPPGYDGKLIKAIRSAQFNPKTLRIVFDLTMPIRVSAVHDDEERNGLLKIDIAAGSEQDASAGAMSQQEDQSPVPFLFTKSGMHAPRIPEEAPAKSRGQEGARMLDKRDVQEKKDNTKRDAKGAALKKPSKPVIVIDPGHGGVDPGTEGPSGTYEKDIVLAYAKALKAVLQKSGRYHVILTRDDDEFIMLRKRVDIARKAGGSIFISLHADSARDFSARGLSVYTVSEKASDTESDALAARENKSDVLSGMDLSDEREDVAGILISLAERETKNRSATLADLLVTSLDEKVHLLSNSHRFAGFAVLKAPDIPSVLVEIGFLSHPQEEKLLKSTSYREKIAKGIASGIDAYFNVEKRMGDK